jgi:hypothetical protein
MYTHTSQYKSWSGKRNLKIGTAVNAACHSFAVPGLYSILGTASLIACNYKKSSYFVTNQLPGTGETRHWKTDDMKMCFLVRTIERYYEGAAVTECGRGNGNILSSTNLT